MLIGCERDLSESVSPEGGLLSDNFLTRSLQSLSTCSMPDA